MSIPNAETTLTPITPPVARKGILNSKTVAFVGIMSALGAILSISTFAIPLGPNLALDLSHIGTYIVAIGGGPILGAIAGALVGIIPSMSPSIANVMVIPGKMLTGFTTGMIFLLLRRRPSFQKSPRARFAAILIAGLVGYLPEMIFTVWNLYFVAFSFMAEELRIATITSVLVKAWIEIVIISVLTATLFSIKAVGDEIDHLVGKKASIGPIEYAVSGIVIALSILFIFPFYFGALPRNEDMFRALAIVLAIIVGVLIGFVAIQMRKTKKEKLASESIRGY